VPKDSENKLNNIALAGTPIADDLKSGVFNQDSLLRLIEVTFAGMKGSEAGTEVLLHLPANLIRPVSKQLPFTEKLDAEDIYICSDLRKSGAILNLRTVGTLSQRHPFRQELLLIFVGKYLCTIIAAWRKTYDDNKRPQPGIWNAAFSFNVEDVITGIKYVKPVLNGGLLDSKITRNWLKTAVSRLLSSDYLNNDNVSWDNYLPDFIIECEQKKRKSESELKWVQLISNVQDAVGWELDTGSLFGSISQVMKKTIGFHYLEIQILEPRGKKFDVTAVHHRNDTAFGGKLLTVILQPKCSDAILHGRKPVLITSDAVEETLMNPKLMKYMNLESGIIVPLIYRKRPNGLLKLFAHRRNHFTTEDLAGIDAIGRIIARSIENVKVHTLMKRMATIDSLTNLFNRRFFNEQLTREFKRSKRYESSLSLIMIDIDHFKHYNDNFGHLRGDQVLVTVSQILRSCVREVDIVSRYGGEEFTVILPEANLEQGLLVAEKIRSTIEKHKFKFGDRQPEGKLTVSLGVTSNTVDVDSINELINRADVALYRAKKSGRNRCDVF